MDPSRITNFSTPTNGTARIGEWPYFFTREQGVRQGDIVIVCVYPEHYWVSVLIPTASALLDQPEQGRAQ